MKAPAARKVAGQAALWLAIAVAAATLWQRAATMPEPMQAEDLSRAARQLKSDALEAAMLAQSLAGGQLTLHFAREQHEQLSDDLEQLRQQLDRPPPTGQEARALDLRATAQRLDEVVLEVPRRMSDASAMAHIARIEQEIARDVDDAGNGSGS